MITKPRASSFFSRQLLSEMEKYLDWKSTLSICWVHPCISVWYIVFHQPVSLLNQLYNHSDRSGMEKDFKLKLKWSTTKSWLLNNHSNEIILSPHPPDWTKIHFLCSGFEENSHKTFPESCWYGLQATIWCLTLCLCLMLMINTWGSILRFPVLGDPLHGIHQKPSHPKRPKTCKQLCIIFAHTNPCTHTFPAVWYHWHHVVRYTQCIFVSVCTPCVYSACVSVWDSYTPTHTHTHTEFSRFIIICFIWKVSILPRDKGRKEGFVARLTEEGWMERT